MYLAHKIQPNGVISYWLIPHN